MLNIPEQNLAIDGTTLEKDHDFHIRKLKKKRTIQFYFLLSRIISLLQEFEGGCNVLIRIISVNNLLY
jgi:hypothetical protein